MIELLITRNDNSDSWSVWATLPDHDALRDSFGFIIGLGETRETAVADAVSALNTAVKQLQLSAVPVRVTDD